MCSWSVAVQLLNAGGGGGDGGGMSGLMSFRQSVSWNKFSRRRRVDENKEREWVSE